MKYIIRIVSIIGLFSISASAYSVDITDTYNAGDVLTATTLDNIKSAVNSKQNIVTGICSPGESIAAINADGTVTCEIDTDTTYTAGSGISIVGTAISTAVQTRYLSLPGNSCYRNPNDQPAFITGMQCKLANQAQSINLEATWPANIPNGAIIRGLRARVYTGSGITTCSLRFGFENTGVIIASVTDITVGWHYTSETTFTHTVDTSTSAYYVSCTSDAVTPTIANTIGHIRIRYTN